MNNTSFLGRGFEFEFSKSTKMYGGMLLKVIFVLLIIIVLILFYKKFWKQYRDEQKYKNASSEAKEFISKFESCFKWYDTDEKALCELTANLHDRKKFSEYSKIYEAITGTTFETVIGLELSSVEAQEFYKSLDTGINQYKKLR